MVDMNREHPSSGGGGKPNGGLRKPGLNGDGSAAPLGTDAASGRPEQRSAISQGIAHLNVRVGAGTQDAAPAAPGARRGSGRKLAAVVLLALAAALALVLLLR